MTQAQLIQEILLLIVSCVGETRHYHDNTYRHSSVLDASDSEACQLSQPFGLACGLDLICELDAFLSRTHLFTIHQNQHGSRQTGLSYLSSDNRLVVACQI